MSLRPEDGRSDHRRASSAPQHRPSILIRNPSFPSGNRAGHSTSIGGDRIYNENTLSETNENAEQEDNVEIPRRPRRDKAATSGSQSSGDGDDDSAKENEDDPITLKDRQSMINVHHPFGLPIWKPALYKKSRSVTRNADEALHSLPSYQAERHFLPGNIFWVLAFGWWLSAVCLFLSAVLRVIPLGGKYYANLVFGLGWYIFWPFGKYVEGDLDLEEDESGSEDEESARDRQPGSSSDDTTSQPTPSLSMPPRAWAAGLVGEGASLLHLYKHSPIPPPIKSYGAVPPSSPSTGSTSAYKMPFSAFLGKACFWLTFITIIAPLLLIVCLICWALVVTIPMARLTWALIKHLYERPDAIRFCAAPPVVVLADSTERPSGSDTGPASARSTPKYKIKHAWLAPGEAAPSGTSTVLLCTYRAVGLQYYKYTVGGVNILFVNLLPVVFFAIFDGFILEPWLRELERDGRHIPAFLALFASHGFIFLLCMLSVIPLSYFIGMAVASISAQSSIGMGAVINATFGSIIEIILYGFALTQRKGHLVEGSIIGSLLAGVLLMPGMSMCSGALRRKEQKFNAKSAGVTSMMLIMAIIGALAPTLFYQTYGNFQLVCTGCPAPPESPRNAPWICDHCYYKHPDPVDDPFYQSTVKSLMYFCAAVLLFSYLVGLWFSLRTHASQIWQNPQPLLHTSELPIHRMSMYKSPNILNTQDALSRKPCDPISANSTRAETSRDETSRDETLPAENGTTRSPQDQAPTSQKRVSYATAAQQPSYGPVYESVDQAVKCADLGTVQLGETMTRDDFTRAVTVATVSALRHQQQQHPRRTSFVEQDGTSSGQGHGGHDAPSWSRTLSASVLLGCTALYAIIAELLVDVVDAVLQESGIDEKFLGVTLFALVPNTTEFMNAISFALNGNIALSMEIGSAYALQVCLLQIPAMVAFSAWYDPANVGEVAKTFTLIFPRWDVCSIILSMFLMTYTYIEAKSNYHRGSILILSYLVLVSGFYLAPATDMDVDQGHFSSLKLEPIQEFSLTFWQSIKYYFLR